MNKKVNTVLFILGATLFNIIVTLISFVTLLILYVKALMPIIPEGGRSWGFPLIFIASIALSFLVYRLALKMMLKKVDVEKYFDPIFQRRKR